MDYSAGFRFWRSGQRRHRDRERPCHAWHQQTIRIARCCVRRRPYVARWGTLCADRSQRRRQNHADQSHHRHACAGCWRDPARRGGYYGAGAGTARAAWARPHLSGQFAISAPVRARVGDACCLRAAAGRTDVVAASRRLSRGNRRSPRNSCHAGTRDGLPSPRPRTALRPRGR